MFKFSSAAASGPRWERALQPYLSAWLAPVADPLPWLVQGSLLPVKAGLRPAPGAPCPPFRCPSARLLPCGSATSYAILIVLLQTLGPRRFYEHPRRRTRPCWNDSFCPSSDCPSSDREYLRHLQLVSLFDASHSPACICTKSDLGLPKALMATATSRGWIYYSLPAAHGQRKQSPCPALSSI